TVVAFRIVTALIGVVYLNFALLILGTRYILLLNIGAYREVIAVLAIRATDTPVHYDAISTSWYRLRPQLQLRGVRVLGASGESVLALPRVDVRISWRSVLSLEPELLRLTALAPVLQAHRDAQGALWIAGFPVAPSVDA